MGITVSTFDGYIFEKANKLTKWYYKPLITCPVCMSSFWGTLMFLVFKSYIGFELIDIAFYFVHVFSVCLINHLFYCFIIKNDYI